MPVLSDATNANILSLLGLVALLAVLAFVASYLVRKLRPQASDAAADTHSIWSSFRAMRQRGELTEQEYRRIRERLSANLRTEWDQQQNTNHRVASNGDTPQGDQAVSGGRPATDESPQVDEPPQQ